MSTRYFGTDGIRGPIDGPLFQPQFLQQVGSSLCQYIGKQRGGESLKIVIGRDTRESGKRIIQDLIKGFTTVPTEIIDIGVVPTPTIALLTRKFAADLGIAVTASHNPASDNGIKLFSSEGTKLSPLEEERIEAFLLTPPTSKAHYTPKQTDCHEKAVYTYLRSMELVAGDLDLTGMKIVCDCANGATHFTTPQLLRQLGAEVICLGHEPDGHNINLHCGSEHPELMVQRLKTLHADVALAHDGDGDRVLVADKSGTQISGDQILGIFAIHALRHDRLPRKSIVATVHSNSGLDLAVQKAGGTVLRSDVGDRNVAALMHESQSAIGGESSGHFILNHYSTTGDGLLAALYLLRILSETGQSLAELSAQIPLLPQAGGKLQVKEKIPLAACTNLNAALRDAEAEMAGSGRTLVRYSGTEPLLRLLVEATTVETARRILRNLELSASKDHDKFAIVNSYSAENNPG